MGAPVGTIFTLTEKSGKNTNSLVKIKSTALTACIRIILHAEKMNTGVKS